MGRYVAVVFSDLERHTDEWNRVPRDRMVATIAEYRYLAESLAGEYGCLYREWAGDGHMFLFESADTAVQFSLRLLDAWPRSASQIEALQGLPQLPLRLGGHFGECTQLGDGEGWIGRGNALAKRVESLAEPETLYVTQSVLDLLDLPLYGFESAGTHALKGDYVAERPLFRVTAFDGAALAARPPEELSAEDWFRRGVALVGTERENTEEETRCYEEALRLRPDYAEAHVNLAVALRSRGDVDEAARHYQEALRSRPEYPEAHYNFAALLAARGSPAGAEEHYRAALAARADYIDAHLGLAALLADRGRLQEADNEYLATLALRPEYAAAHANYAVLLDQLERPAEATRHYEEALRIEPGRPHHHYNYALLLERLDRQNEALEEYRRALGLWPDYAEAHNNLAALLHARGELDEAEEHYRRALALRPGDPEAHYNLALLLRARGDEAEARRELSTAYELAPDVPEFRSALESL
ncbi:MAG: tetratricopeptide repeat protein [Gaiellaceae bacterium]